MQGATWCRTERKYVIHDEAPGQVTATIRALDVDFLPQLAGPDWTGDTALFAFRSQELTVLSCGAALPLTLEQLQYELFTVTPIKVSRNGGCVSPIWMVQGFLESGCHFSLTHINWLQSFGCKVQFAPIGLLQMYNSGGSIVSVEYNIFQMSALASREVVTSQVDEVVVSGAVVTIYLRGCGLFGAYCSHPPSGCRVNGAVQICHYDSTTQMMQVVIPEKKDMCNSLYISFDFPNTEFLA